MENTDALAQETELESDMTLNSHLAGDLIEIIPRVMRQIRNEMRKVAKKDLTIAQLRILSRLYQDTCTITELADHHGVSVAAMSKMVSKLEAKELLERASSESDRRHVSVILTEIGKQKFLAIRKAVRKKVAEDIKVLSQAQREATAVFLKAMEELYRF
jgi:DNA-binding MarR family transcriptional regulator